MNVLYAIVAWLLGMVLPLIIGDKWVGALVAALVCFSLIWGSLIVERSLKISLVRQELLGIMAVLMMAIIANYAFFAS